MRSSCKLQSSVSDVLQVFLETVLSALALLVRTCRSEGVLKSL